MSGSVKVVSDGPIGGMLRFDLPDIGEAVVGASPPIGDAIFPVRRQEGGINTGVAIHNLESSPGLVRCELLREGVLLDAVSIPLEANGQTSWLIDQAFPNTDTSDFTGSVRCDAVGEDLFSAVALEMDPGTRIFTTLPCFRFQRGRISNRAGVPVLSEEQWEGWSIAGDGKPNRLAGMANDMRRAGSSAPLLTFALAHFPLHVYRADGPFLSFSPSCRRSCGPSLRLSRTCPSPITGASALSSSSRPSFCCPACRPSCTHNPRRRFRSRYRPGIRCQGTRQSLPPSPWGTWTLTATPPSYSALI